MHSDVRFIRVRLHFHSWKNVYMGVCSVRYLMVCIYVYVLIKREKCQNMGYKEGLYNLPIRFKTGAFLGGPSPQAESVVSRRRVDCLLHVDTSYGSQQILTQPSWCNQTTPKLKNPCFDNPNL